MTTKPFPPRLIYSTDGNDAEFACTKDKVTQEALIRGGTWFHIEYLSLEENAHLIRIAKVEALEEALEAVGGSLHYSIEAVTKLIAKLREESEGG